MQVRIRWYAIKCPYGVRGLVRERHLQGPRARCNSSQRWKRTVADAWNACRSGRQAVHRAGSNDYESAGACSQ